VSLKISPLLHYDRSHEKVSFPYDSGSGHLRFSYGVRIVHTGRTTNGAENRFENGRLGLFGTQVFKAGYSETTLIRFGRPGNQFGTRLRFLSDFANSLSREFFHFRRVGRFTACSSSGIHALFQNQSSFFSFFSVTECAGFVFHPIPSG